MKVNKKKALVALIAAAIGFSGTNLAHAQDSSVEVEVETQVSVGATTTREKPRLLPLRPAKVDELREKAGERIQNLRDGIKAQHVETRLEIRNATSVEDRMEVRQEAREQRDQMRDKAKEIRGNVKERIQALVKTHVGAVIKRSENALNMFDNLVQRMESRIEKLKTGGTNTASVETSLSASVALVAGPPLELEPAKVKATCVAETASTAILAPVTAPSVIWFVSTAPVAISVALMQPEHARLAAVAEASA